MSLVVAFLYAGVTGLVLCAILGHPRDLAVVRQRRGQRDRAGADERRSGSASSSPSACSSRCSACGWSSRCSSSGSPRSSARSRPSGSRWSSGPPSDPTSYAALLNAAYPQIAAFGGTFLLMLFLDWLFEDRDIRWLSWLEKPLAKIGQLDAAVDRDRARRAGRACPRRWPTDPNVVLMSGALGLVTYLLVNGLGEFFDQACGRRGSRRGGRARAQRLGPSAAGQGHRQGGLLPLPLPRGARRGVLVRRRDRRVRHHHRPDPHRAGPRLHRGHVRPLAHGVPRAQGHAGRLRLPRARRALGDRRPVGDPARRASATTSTRSSPA